MNDDQIPALITRLRAGDADARHELFVYVEERFHSVAHRLLRLDFPRVGLLAETDDILHDALCRLIPYLEKPETEPCSSAERFYALVATVLRHTLIDVARKHFGTLQSHTISAGIEANHPLLQESSGLGGWRESVRVHELVERLPAAERRVIEMTLYLGFGTGEIARRLGIHAGNVSRRLASAKELLGQMLRQDDRCSE
jgi:RNA polymerase sigma factor (sigma-70 family)